MSEQPSPNKTTAQTSLVLSRIFKITAKELKALFSGNSLEHFLKHDKVPGILNKLKSEEWTGISGDEKDINRRISFFGENQKPKRQRVSIFQSIKQEAGNILWLAVIGTAILAGIINAFIDGWFAFFQGITIVIFALIIICFSSVADYTKDKQFVKLNAEIREKETVTVIRGKFGRTETISVWNLVVGDVVFLGTGARTPADCVVIDSAELRVEELNSDGDKLSFAKSAYDQNNRSSDPFLKSNSLITTGSCKALVCCVGKNSSSFKQQSEDDEDLSASTELEKKLKRLEKIFTYYSMIWCIVVFVLLIIMTIIEVLNGDDEYLKGQLNKNYKSSAAIIFSRIPVHLNTCVVLLIVAIPDGLPMVIQLSLAFSVGKMQKENILIQKLDAPEKAGGVDEILCGKTATITRNQMKVKEFYLQGTKKENSRKDTFKNCLLTEEIQQLVRESILYNNNAHIEMGDTRYEPKGDGTETALLKFLQNCGDPIHADIKKKFRRVLAEFPFSSEEKLSAYAINHPDKKNTVQVYIKGAPEKIIDMCTNTISFEGLAELEQQMDYGEGKTYREDFQTAVHEMASSGLRVIAFAYHEYVTSEWEQHVSMNNESEGLGFGENSEGSADRYLKVQIQNKGIPFILLGAFGLKDYLRENVVSAIKYAKDDGQLTVRMISGDHIETARAVARKAQIIETPKQAEVIDNEDQIVEQEHEYTVMHADRFEQLVGMDQDGRITNQQEFDNIMAKLKVLARSKPIHKKVIVQGIQKQNKSVLVTGDGINDVDAIISADVGISMGGGCTAAKAQSEMILIDDDFQDVLKAIMWGRNIHDNIGRFLMFQVTVNISCILTVIISLPWLAESPFSPVQLLWINMIMDTLGALALSTESPLKGVINGPPFKDDSPLMTPAIWRQIYGIAIYQVIVMIFVIYLGPTIWDLHYTITDNTVCGTKECEAKKKHLTIGFNIFVLMQVFNAFNSRKVGATDFHIFEAIHKNGFFIIVMIAEFVLQYIWINQFGALTRSSWLNMQEWGTCLFIGLSVLPIAFFIKLTPVRWLDKFKKNTFVDENDDTYASKGLVKAFDSVANTTVDFDKMAKKSRKKDDNFTPIPEEPRE